MIDDLIKLKYYKNRSIINHNAELTNVYLYEVKQKIRKY